MSATSFPIQARFLILAATLLLVGCVTTEVQDPVEAAAKAAQSQSQSPQSTASNTRSTLRYSQPRPIQRVFRSTPQTTEAEEIVPTTRVLVEKQVLATVQRVQDNLDFVVLDFGLNLIPEPGTRLEVFRNDQPVGEVKVGRITRGTTVVADKVQGSPRIGDEIRRALSRESSSGPEPATTELEEIRAQVLERMFDESGEGAE